VIRSRNRGGKRKKGKEGKEEEKTGADFAALYHIINLLVDYNLYPQNSKKSSADKKRKCIGIKCDIPYVR
jgi:hypothetical protein